MSAICSCALKMVALSARRVSARKPADPRVIVVTVDGYRWQEFFGGADPAYFTRNSKGVIEAAAADYAGPTAEARRARIMPFVWQTVARDGQIFGDAARQRPDDADAKKKATREAYEDIVWALVSSKEFLFNH